MKWKTLNVKIIEANEHLRFMAEDFETGNGKRGKYFYHTNAYGDEAVNVFVQKKDGTFVMTREYRYLFDQATLSMPQGSIETGESAEDAARRETLEEAGYKVGVLVDLGWFATAPAFSKERARIFLAQDVEPVGQKLDVMEEIETVEMTADEIDQAIADGTMWDGQAIASWYKVRAYLVLRHSERSEESL